MVPGPKYSINLEFPQAYGKRAALLLDGMRDGDPGREVVPANLLKSLDQVGWNTRTICLRKTRISPCMGEFGCWVRTPGVCIIDDESKEIARLLVQSDMVVFLTEITFGGFSSELKKALDRVIGNVSPFFEKFDGEIRHKARYDRYPGLVVLGVQSRRDGEAEKVFRDEARRVTVDLRFSGSATYIVHANEEEQPPSPPSLLVDSRTAVIRTGAKKRKLLLLVGSPKSSRSNSESLGAYLLSSMDDNKFERSTVHVLPSFCSEPRMESLLDAAEACDDLVLSFPLYVDGLPAPVVKFMERLVARRKEEEKEKGPIGSQQKSLLAICNGGFPEAEHSYTALNICELFAREAGMKWMGGLALGGGQGIINERPLDSLPESVAGRIRRSLRLTADALGRGDSVPEEAIKLMEKPSIVTASSRIYAWMGNFGWKRAAKQYGTTKRLEETPYPYS